MEDAEAGMRGMAEHAATAAVGEGELAEFGVVGVRAFFGHGMILWIRFFGRARDTAGRRRGETHEHGRSETDRRRCCGESVL